MSIDQSYGTALSGTYGGKACNTSFDTCAELLDQILRINAGINVRRQNNYRFVVVIVVTKSLHCDKMLFNFDEKLVISLICSPMILERNASQPMTIVMISRPW